MSLKLSNNKKITTRSGISIKRIRRRSDMAIIWQAVTDTDVTALTSSYQSGDILIGNDGFTNRVLLYGPIDASLYKGIQITITGCDGHQNYSGSSHTIGIGSTPTNSAAYSTALTASSAVLNISGGESNSISASKTITLNFAESSGNVYVYAGIISGDGHGSWNFVINPTVTLLAR